MAQSQIRIKVDVAGVYCVRYLSSTNQLLSGYDQDQCYVTAIDEDFLYINLLLPGGSYIVPKIRIYKGYAGSEDFNDITNAVIDCATSSSQPPVSSSSLPYCGCSGLNSFVINSIVYQSGGNYQVVFNACIANPLNWQVRDDTNATVASGSLVPTSGVVIIPVGAQAEGLYTMIFSSTACAGTAIKEFIITEEGSGSSSSSSSSSSSQPPSGNQQIVIEDYSVGDSGVSSFSIEDSEPDSGLVLNLTLSLGVEGEATDIVLKSGSTIVGTRSAGYSEEMSIISSVYGHLDVYINGVDKGTVYLPQRLFGAYTVEEGKGVDEDDGFMKLEYIQESNGTFTINDLGETSFNVKYYNINGKWRNSSSLGIQLEPNITHSITKYGYNGGYWGDNSQAQAKKQITFKIVPNVAKDFIFEVNLTGNAFDFNNPGNSFISDDKIQLINDALTGPDNEQVDSIRMPFIWGDYNPSAGVYKDAELTAAINWVKTRRVGRPIKIALLIVPVLGKPGGSFDSRIPANQRQVDNGGNEQDCTYNFNTVPSYFSSAMTTLLNTGYDHLLPYLVTNHGADIRVIEMGAGQSEEHYMPYTGNNGTGTGCSNYSGIGDYSAGASLPAWRVWLNIQHPGGGNLPYTINGNTYTAATAQLPSVGLTVGNNDNMDYGQEAYRDLFRFYSKGIFDVWKRFHDKVREHTSFKTGFVVADLLNRQGTGYTFHGGAVFLAMKYADQFYHTDNISTSDWHANLWGVDLQLGTFPNQGKLPAIEFDTFDAGSNGTVNPINTVHVKAVMLRFIKNGGKVVHTALGWSTSQMNQWKALVKDIRDNNINNPSWTLEDRSLGTTVNVDTYDMFSNPELFRDAWLSVGGNHALTNAAYNASPTNLVIENDGDLDNFWYNPSI